MPFDDRIANITTPHRVFALCKAASLKKYTKDELRKLIQPENLTKGTQQFDDVFKFSEKGKLIRIDDNNRVASILSKNILDDINVFRRYIAEKSLNNNKLMFSRFSSWYILHGDLVFKENDEKLAKNFHIEVFDERGMQRYNKTNIQAWRTWFCFLGLGLLHNGIAIPNAALRIQDVLSNDEKLPREKSIPFSKFMKWLNDNCPELDGGNISEENKGKTKYRKKELSLALSFGLHTLRENKIVNPRYTPDSTDIWHMRCFDGKKETEQISEIILNE